MMAQLLVGRAGAIFTLRRRLFHSGKFHILSLQAATLEAPNSSTSSSASSSKKPLFGWMMSRFFFNCAC